jgi:FAD/FMN-containing dehydrogenase
LNACAETDGVSHPLAAVSALLGPEHVLTGDAVRPFAHDIFRSRNMPLAVIAPGTVDELQAVVRISAEAAVAVFPRGGGASYTDGYLPTRDHAWIVDLRRLDRIVDINEMDAYVTVEAGVTWTALKAALDAKGLRTPFRGPFSGLVATVGGAVAQHAISHGTGGHGGVANSVVSLDIILANGEMLRTGSASRVSAGEAADGAAPFLRDFGPDLTGVFIGDCGAFGIKARITLPLLQASSFFAGASFAFDSFEAMHAGMRAAAYAGVDDTHFALDAAMLRGQLSAKRSLKDSLDIARGVLNRAPSFLSGLRQVTSMAFAGERALRQAPYIAHYLIEGPDRLAVQHDLRRLSVAIKKRLSTRDAPGKVWEIPNTVPAVVRAEPFARMFNILGPKGERWVPVHGVLPHSSVMTFHRALNAFYAERRALLERHGVWTGTMFEAVGRGAFLYEVGIYWRDSLSSYHLETLSSAKLAKLPKHPCAPEARAWVSEFKRDLVALFDRFGATHFQLGKAYPYLETLSPAAMNSVQG